MTIKWLGFFNKVKDRHDWFWVGETHGIQNNYKVYKEMLRNKLFNVLAIELPEELEQFSENSFRKYKTHEDGRFSKESLEFYKWIKEHEVQLVCFDCRKGEDQAKGELSMANCLVSKIKRDKRVLIVSGSYHAQTTTQKNTKSMAKIVKERTNKNILNIGLKYSGGEFYNFGAKELSSSYLNYDKNNLPFGMVTKNTNPLASTNYWFHCGKAKAVTLLG